MIRLLTFICLLLSGCSAPHHEAEKIIAKVGPYEITYNEFQEAYKDSSYSAQDTPAFRRAFLNNMINQKLILLDALNRGMNRDKTFLKMIENFWQQSLITADLQQRSREGGNLDTWLEYLKHNTTITINEESLK